MNGHFIRKIYRWTQKINQREVTEKKKRISREGKKKKKGRMRKKKRKIQKPNEKRKIKRNGTLKEDTFVQNRGWFLFPLFFPIWRNYIWVGTGKKLLRPIRISHIFLPLPNNSHTIRPFSLNFSIPSFSTPTKHTLNFLFPFSLVSFPLIEDDLG